MDGLHAEMVSGVSSALKTFVTVVYTLLCFYGWDLSPPNLKKKYKKIE